MQFNKFTPATLRFAIEKELQAMEMPNVKMAAVIALNNLKEDPGYYMKRHGFVDSMQKARIVKYKRRWKGKDGKWEYEYYDAQQNDKDKTEKIKLQMRFDANSLFFNFNEIGFEKRVGNEKTSKESLETTKLIENNIQEFDKEYTSVLNSKGEILFSKVGNYDEISFNNIEINKLRNSEILTHTHPENKSFSVEDVFLSLSLGIKELRVKTPDEIYFFKISHKKELNETQLISNNRMFMAVLINLNNQITEKLREKVKNKIITPEKAEKEHREILWEMVESSPLLQSFFNIEYGKVKNGN